MLPVVRVKNGVNFSVISPGGFRILSALDHLAIQIDHDVTITSACDGTHSGPTDPHHLGKAYDIRTKDLPNKHDALAKIQASLGDRFFAWIEEEGGDNEHIHCQVRKGTDYPPNPASGAVEIETLAVSGTSQPTENPSTPAEPEANNP